MARHPRKSKRRPASHVAHLKVCKYRKTVRKASRWVEGRTAEGR